MKKIILCFFILLKFTLQYLLIGQGYELHRDEFLHIDQGYHPAFGFVSVPPVTSLLSTLIIACGKPVFLVKFIPALFGALTIFIVWKTIEALGGNLFALILGATSLTFSILLRVNMLYQPNSLDIFSWTLFFYCFLRFIQTDNNKWIWFCAITFATGFLNKYNIIFLLIGLIPALLLTSQRKIFTNKHVWLSAILALLIVFPNLVWQWQHNFPVYHHLKELSDTQLVNVERTDFIKEQFLFFIGSVFVLITAFIALQRHTPFRPFRIFLLSYFFTLFAFLYFKAKGYYAIGLYPILFAFGSVYLEYLLVQYKYRFVKPILILVVIAAFIPFIQVAFPVLPPEQIAKKAQLFKKMDLLRWEDGKDHSLPQDFADMLGWKELAQKTKLAYDSFPGKENTLILCDNYGEAGAINYYGKLKSKAVSFNADYINWFPLHKEIISVLLITENKLTNAEIESQKKFFGRITYHGEITNLYAREHGTSIYLLQQPLTNINKLLAKQIRLHKKNREM